MLAYTQTTTTNRLRFQIQPLVRLLGSTDFIMTSLIIVYRWKCRMLNLETLC